MIVTLPFLVSAIISKSEVPIIKSTWVLLSFNPTSLGVLLDFMHSGNESPKAK